MFKHGEDQSIIIFSILFMKCDWFFFSSLYNIVLFASIFKPAVIKINEGAFTFIWMTVGVKTKFVKIYFAL